MNQLLASTGGVNVSQGHDAILIYYYLGKVAQVTRRKRGRIDRPKRKDRHEGSHEVIPKKVFADFKMGILNCNFPHR
jgi:hypothetical protein